MLINPIDWLFDRTTDGRLTGLVILFLTSERFVYAWSTDGRMWRITQV